MTKSKIQEIDIVRAFAMMAVLLIHGTASATVEIEHASASHFFFLFINKISNFAVPTFIFISGLVLFYRYFDDWSHSSFISFYRKRVKLIIIPYLLWSVFYYFFNQILLHPAHIHFDLLHFLYLLPLGSAEYHLYFISIIAQLYILFPILLTISHRFSWFRKQIIWIGLVIQSTIYGSHYLHITIPHRADLSLTYIGFFCIGAWIGMNYSHFLQWLQKSIYFILPFSIFLGILYAFLFEFQTYFSAPIQLYDIIFNIYPIFISISLIWISVTLLKKKTKLIQLLVSFGSASFGIYFVHPVILALWSRYIHHAGSVIAYDLYVISALLLLFTIPWGLTIFYRRLVKLSKGSRIQKQQAVSTIKNPPISGGSD